MAAVAAWETTAWCERDDASYGSPPQQLVSSGREGRTPSLPQILPPVTDHRVIVWERLEEKRARRYGLHPLRNFNVTRTQRSKRDISPVEWTLYQLDELNRPRSTRATSASLTSDNIRRNSIAPFGTLAPKATCGYYFSMDTNNRKLRIGIPPSDLMKWRSDNFAQSNAGTGHRAVGATKPNAAVAPRAT